VVRRDCADLRCFLSASRALSQFRVLEDATSFGLYCGRMTHTPIPRQLISRASLLLLLSSAAAQVLSFPNSGTKFSSATTIDSLQAARITSDIFTINGQNPNKTPLQKPSGSVSKFDLKAPGKARKEYQKGYELLLRKDLKGAVQHLEAAVRIYPNFVAAHNVLGTAYLDLNQNEKAREEFSRAIALDDHLPNSYINLGIAQLGLKQYSPAEESLRKASAIAPADVQLAVALTYAEFLNRDYPGVIATATQVHSRPHKGAELVHYFGAAAWAGQDNLAEAQHQMETLLEENPSSASAEQYRQILAQMKSEQALRTMPKLRTPEAARNVPSTAIPQKTFEIQRALLDAQDARERSQIAEAESALDVDKCESCGGEDGSRPAAAQSPRIRAKSANTGFLLRSSVDEVDLFFAATDHGNSVTNLTPADIRVQDDGRPPDRITGFRNESQLPLRLGMVIDTSDSVKGRLSFEQKAATKFLDDVLTDSRDMAFVVGVNNSVLLVEDFTAEHARISHAVNQLAPGGGTALWDAVDFASKKLVAREETQPVARVLVVISDGQDNSSSVTLKQAIASALRGETIVYSISTRELLDEESTSLLGDHALRTLSELTGGATFIPGSTRRLESSLRDVQQVIRARYLLTYKPASLESDGRYRSIELKAERDGRQLKVFARKGYYASSPPLQFRSSTPAP
jgi:Ca-activated chloride channel family protein